MLRYSISLFLFVIIFQSVEGKRFLDKNLTKVNDIAFSFDGNILACTNGNNINIYDVQSGQLTMTLDNIHTQSVLSIDFSADNQSLVSCGIDSLVVLWNLNNTDSAKIVGKTDGIATCARMSNDNMFIAAGSSTGRIFIWGTQGFMLLKTLSFHELDVTCLDFSPNSKYLSCGAGDKLVSFWDVSNWGLLQVVRNHSSWIRNMAFSPVANYFVTVGDNSQLFFDDFKNPRQISNYGKFSPGFAEWLMGVDYNTTGDMLVTATNSGKVFLLIVMQNYKLKLKEQINKVKFKPNSYTVAVATQKHGVVLFETKEMEAMGDENCEYVKAK